MFLLRILLYPFSILYGWVARVRNRLYDIGVKPSAQFDIPVIGVGNITVGGTGKTPMVEYLIRLLRDEWNLATLSRGYGRKTRGFRIAKKGDTAHTLGDEPYQMYSKFGDKVVVAVGEERALAIPLLLHEHSETSAILLDDAYQHRAVKPSLNILLIDYNRLIFNDFMLPSGRLREPSEGASRADVIVITKCPIAVTEEDSMSIQHAVRELSAKPLFFAGIQYGNLISFGSSTAQLGEKAILVTGLASAQSFKKHVGKSFKIVDHLEYRDHHAYTKTDINSFTKKGDNNTIIITTEKDMVKLIATELMPLIEQMPLYYLPIECVLLKNGEDFDALVLDHVRKFTTKNVAKEA